MVAPGTFCTMSTTSSEPARPLPCPVCAAATGRLFRKAGHWVRHCTGCGHRFAEITADPEHVARLYGDQYFFGGGAGYPDYLREGELLRAQGRRYCQMLAGHCSPGTVLDVGAAAGFLLESFLEAGWRGTAVEPNRTMAEHMRSRLGIEVFNGPLDQFGTDRKFDLVLMIEVISHFTDLRRSLAAAAAVTRPGGLWLIETWDRRSLTARLFGRHWHEYNPPTVLHWFSAAGLRLLAGQFGFREIARGRPRKRLSGDHARSAVLHALQGTALRRAARPIGRLVPERLSLPYPGDDLFWALFSLQAP